MIKEEHVKCFKLIRDHILRDYIDKIDDDKLKHNVDGILDRDSCRIIGAYLKNESVSVTGGGRISYHISYSIQLTKSVDTTHKYNMNVVVADATGICSAYFNQDEWEAICGYIAMEFSIIKEKFAKNGETAQDILRYVLRRNR
jgi:hypothetical protein